VDGQDRDPPIWRWRRWNTASCVVVLACLVVFYVTARPGWTWPPFVWCVASGVAGAVGALVLTGRLARAGGQPAARVRQNQRTYPWLWLWIGLVGGALAGMSGWAWIGYALAAYVVLVAAVMAIGLVVLRRRVSPRPR
jgi:hypothetical protein